ncbi:uncharacterized protein LOC122838343 [Gambusia affinis]|uniref:uncharacterized protein LOC122838343 n=1 Tax=Gambusia affinis TaxID=33528 RepID=UPI001CDCB928|nr:uncharacterized protein LOC122838343 [Gambusia affinis]
MPGVKEKRGGGERSRMRPSLQVILFGTDQRLLVFLLRRKGSCVSTNGQEASGTFDGMPGVKEKRGGGERSRMRPSLQVILFGTDQRLLVFLLRRKGSCVSTNGQEASGTFDGMPGVKEKRGGERSRIPASRSCVSTNGQEASGTFDGMPGVKEKRGGGERSRMRPSLQVQPEKLKDNIIRTVWVRILEKHSFIASRPLDVSMFVYKLSTSIVKRRVLSVTL